jgi:hypothetical protein
MVSYGWVKLMRSDSVEDLIAEAPLAFVLAAVIAMRARFKPGLNPVTGLFQGEAFLGDHNRYGMTQQQYRTAKRQLEKFGFAAFRTTNKGTIAKLTGTRLFEVFNFAANKQITTGQQPPNNKQEC